MPSTAATLLTVAFLSVGAQGTFLRSKVGADQCGKGFENLNEGSQKYFDTTKALWAHPGRVEQFGTFEKELKCWYTFMLSTKCGGLESQAAARKADLTKKCMDIGVTHFAIWNKYTKAEVDWFKRNYPNDAEDYFATADYRESANTVMSLNKKEMLCQTLFVIDDNCVDSMYMRTA